MSNKIYYKGREFSSVDEAMEFAQKYNKEPLSEDNVEQSLESIRLDILQNLKQISAIVTNEVFVKELNTFFYRLLNIEMETK